MASNYQVIRDRWVLTPFRGKWSAEARVELVRSDVSVTSKGVEPEYNSGKRPSQPESDKQEIGDITDEVLLSSVSEYDILLGPMSAVEQVVEVMR
jgi:hypothetical protein